MIAAALLLMAARRGIVFYQRLAGDIAPEFNFAAEMTALVISILMLIGVLLVKPYLVALQEAESTARKSEADYRSILNNMVDTFYRTDNEGRLVMMSPSAETLLGYSVEELTGMRLMDLYADPKARDRFLQKIAAQGYLTEEETRLIRKGGRVVVAETNARQVKDKEGNVLGIEGVARDITERRAAETLNTRLGRVVESSVNEVYVFDSQSFKFILVNKGARKNLGYSIDELRELTPVDIKPMFTDEEFSELVSPLRNGSEETVSFETVHCRKDGSTYPVSVHLQLSTSESPPVFFAIIEDVTERDRAKRELTQAQKMETLGQLTGGIAHDFNNLLTVVLGNLELAEYDPDCTPLLSGYIQDSAAAARRGAALTEQLLAFSRKQALQPEIIDLGTLMVPMDKLLRRSLRENIEVEIVVEEGLWTCEIDPIQLENAILNLAINARDAMPEGGKLSIELHNRFLDEPASGSGRRGESGEYVSVSVSDNGGGMSAETVERAFDPFFTTKSTGEGSGLGLSMVHGFVTQSGGFVDIRSEVNKGTTIEICLPRTLGNVEKETSRGLLHDTKYGRGELIVAVEDNDPLGKVVVNMLQQLGYTALHAPEANSALETLENTEDVRLLLTDIVLPGMNGIKLAEKAGRKWPGIPVLFMSGYSADAETENGRLNSKVNLLRKPFTMHELGEKLHEILRRN